MSAFVVSKSTISVLVAAGKKLVEDAGERVSRIHLDKIGQDLLDECVRSVSYRYPNDDLGELPGTYPEETICEGIAPISVAEWLTPYTYAEPDHELTREEIEEEISSYEYQSCEHPAWEESWSQSYCAGLRANLGQFPTNLELNPPPPLSEEAAEIARAASDRNETIRRIRAALKRRSGKSWSVTGGRGTGWGWIHIQSPPKRRTGKHVQREGAAFGEYEHVDTGVAQEFGLMTPQDCAELGELLGLGRPCHHQGHGIPASSDYRRYYIEAAEGLAPTVSPKQYWD